MDNMLIYSSNVAYHVCKDTDREKVIDDESVSKEIKTEPTYEEIITTDQHLSNTNNSLAKMKKILIVMILICIVLVIITLTAITFSVLSYHLSQKNGVSTTTITQEIHKLDERIKSNLANLHTQSYCGAGQWHRIAFLNMSDPSQQCPAAWREYNTSGVRACRRPVSPAENCSATTYSTGRQYTRVCGRAIGYQLGSPDAFERIGRNDIDLDGINITHGPQQDHIWSYIAGVNENESSRRRGKCPCAGGKQPPLYIGNRYYCESGNPNEKYTQITLYTNNPLWDGQQCEDTCCTGTNSPPWFSIRLLAPTTDLIKVNLCCDQHTLDEDIPIALLEIYIQ